MLPSELGNAGVKDIDLLVLGSEITTGVSKANIIATDLTTKTLLQLRNLIILGAGLTVMFIPGGLKGFDLDD